MHHARLKQRFYMHTDFTFIRIVPMHGFMKNSDYSCTVTMHVQKIQKIEVGPVEHPSVAAVVRRILQAPVLNLRTGTRLRTSLRTKKLHNT